MSDRDDFDVQLPLNLDDPVEYLTHPDWALLYLRQQRRLTVEARCPHCGLPHDCTREIIRPRPNRGGRDER